MSSGYLALVVEKARLKEQELGRPLTLEEQNQIKDEAMREAFLAAARAVAQQESRDE